MGPGKRQRGSTCAHQFPPRRARRREEKRLFVNDLNGPLYILDKETKKATIYLDFNGLPGKPGIFHRLAIDQLLASGFISFEFDPDYAHNGKFYTIHLEDPSLPASNLPDNQNFPGLNPSGYTVTPAIRTFGPTEREAVLIEWTDTNTSNSTFEGTARELDASPVQRQHSPHGRFDFQPGREAGRPRLARHVHRDRRRGQRRADIQRPAANPQRLDMLVGKILRIIPDIQEHVDRSTVSENGRYRIPKDNPFASKSGARKEIWAYGLLRQSRIASPGMSIRRTGQTIT